MRLKSFSKKIKGKRVLVRCGLNIPFDENGKISDDFRIKQAVPTIKYLTEKKGKVIIISHFKEEGGVAIKKGLSSFLEKDVDFVDDCIGKQVQKKIEEMEEGDVLLLNSVRKYKGEKENSKFFGKELSELGDFFVNDAFPVSHRKHASVYQIPRFLPSAMGLLMEKEVSALNKIIKKPKKPVVVLIGGAKIESKAGAIDYFLKKGYTVLLGGKVANSVIGSKMFTSKNLYLPVDGITCNKKEVKISDIKKYEDVFDIGPETVKLYGEVVKKAGTIIWAGPLGFFEKSPFHKGTEQVGKIVAENSSAFKVCGGGETNYALQKLKVVDKMDLVSSGGGAMLAYLTEKEMPGIKAIEKLKTQKSKVKTAI
jgi:phosphoglycerate kinase